MSDRCVSLAEVRQILLELKSVRPETAFSPFHNSTLSIAQSTPLSIESANGLFDCLKALSLTTNEGKEYKLNDAIICKIVDILPATNVEIRSIISREHIVLSETSIKEILDTVSNYN
ncbi:MAG: hypothetical protein MJY64_01215 [archaeon]|nr:hypothetical protein [archaeon]